MHRVPAPAQVATLESNLAGIVGAIAMAVGLALYGLAPRAFGAAWRLGIDRSGELVTRGGFARSHNPVYVGLALVMVGDFLVLGRWLLLVLAVVSSVHFRYPVRREERFAPSSLRRADRRFPGRDRGGRINARGSSAAGHWAPSDRVLEPIA